MADALCSEFVDHCTGPENEGVSRNNFNAIESYPNQNKLDQVFYNWQLHNTWLESRMYLQVSLRQWGAGNVLFLVLSS